MIGKVDPINLPGAFIINGQSVPYGMVKGFIADHYGPPVSGFIVDCVGDDGRKYFCAVRVLFEASEDSEFDWRRGGWSAEFYSTKKAAARVLKTGWKRVFDDGYDIQDAA